MPASSRPTDARSPGGGAATISWGSRTRSPSCACSADFPVRHHWRLTGKSCGSPLCSWGADAETIHAYAGRQQTVSEHQQRIGEYLRLRTFDAAAGERLARFLEDEALRLERTASLLARARAWLRDEHVLAPADSVLRRRCGTGLMRWSPSTTTSRTRPCTASRTTRSGRSRAWAGSRPSSTPSGWSRNAVQSPSDSKPQCY